MGADTGVGSVELVMAVVAADAGVKAAEQGVKGVLILGESSVLADRSGMSTGVLPDRSRLSEACCVKRGTADVEAGITRGVRLFGDNGCRSSPWLLNPPRSSCFCSGDCSNVGDRKSTIWFCFHDAPGALIERSWKGGRPGIVAMVGLVQAHESTRVSWEW